MAEPVKPSDVDENLSSFDRFATAANDFVSRAWFFTACVVAIVAWSLSRPLFADTNTWQLVVNSATTVVTFLLVALLQNTASRSNRALQRKLNAIADALADALDATTSTRGDVEELRSAVGLEQRESS